MTTTTSSVSECMATVEEMWPAAPPFSSEELRNWRQAAESYADEWGTALGRCLVERRASSDEMRRRCRPDLAEVVAMCMAIRGRYRQRQGSGQEGCRLAGCTCSATGPVVEAPDGLTRVRALRRVLMGTGGAKGKVQRGYAPDPPVRATLPDLPETKITGEGGS